MERYAFYAFAAFMILGGFWMLVRPREAALMQREHDEGSHPPTGGEVWNMRLFGVFFVVVGICSLYAMILNLPGADFLTP